MLTVSLQLRKATTEDQSTLARFIQAMARDSEGLQLNPDTLKAGVESVLNNPALGHYWLLESIPESQPVGMCLITLEWSDWHNAPYWWMQSVYIHPDFRGQNAFAAMLKTLETEARKAGAHELRLYVDKSNTRAIRAYEKTGWESSHYLVMQKSL